MLVELDLRALLLHDTTAGLGVGGPTGLHPGEQGAGARGQFIGASDELAVFDAGVVGNEAGHGDRPALVGGADGEVRCGQHRCGFGDVEASVGA